MRDQGNSRVPRGIGYEALTISRMSSCRPTTSLPSQTVPMVSDIAAAAGAAAIFTTEVVATDKAQAANVLADEDFGTSMEHVTKPYLPSAPGSQKTGCPALHAYDSAYTTGGSVTERSAPATTAALSSEGKPSSVSASSLDCHGGDNGGRLPSEHSFRFPSSSLQIAGMLAVESPLKTKNSEFPLDSAQSFKSELAATSSAPEAAAFRLDGGNGSESSNSARAENFEALIRGGGSRKNGSSPPTARHSLCSSCGTTTKDSIRTKRGRPSSVPPHMTTQGNKQEKEQTSGKIRTVPDTLLAASSTKRMGQHDSLEGLRLNCDYCVKKKVKCSRGIPCSACNRKGLVCEFSYKQKPGPKVRRVDIPSTEDCHGGRDQRTGKRVLDPSQTQHLRQKFQRKMEQQGCDHTDKEQERLRLQQQQLEKWSGNELYGLSQRHAHDGAASTLDYLPHQGIKDSFDPQNRFGGGLTGISLDHEFRLDASWATTIGDVRGGGSSDNGLRRRGRRKSRGRGYFEPAVPAPAFSYPPFRSSYDKESNRAGKKFNEHRDFRTATAKVATEVETAFGNAETSVLTFVPQPSFPQGEVSMTENVHFMVPPSTAPHRLNDIYGTSSLIDIEDYSREEVDKIGDDFRRVGGDRRIGDVRTNSGVGSNHRGGSSGNYKNYTRSNCNNCSSSGVDVDIIGGDVLGAISTTARRSEPNPEPRSPQVLLSLPEKQLQSYATQSTFEEAWSAQALLSMRRL